MACLGSKPSWNLAVSGKRDAKWMHDRCEYFVVLSIWNAFNACYGEGSDLKPHLTLPRPSAVGGTQGRVKVCLFGGEMRMGFMPNLSRAYTFSFNSLIFLPHRRASSLYP